MTATYFDNFFKNCLNFYIAAVRKDLFLYKKGADTAVSAPANLLFVIQQKISVCMLLVLYIGCAVF